MFSLLDWGVETENGLNLRFNIMGDYTFLVRPAICWVGCLPYHGFQGWSSPFYFMNTMIIHFKVFALNGILKSLWMMSTTWLPFNESSVAAGWNTQACTILGMTVLKGSAIFTLWWYIFISHLCLFSIYFPIKVSPTFYPHPNFNANLLYWMWIKIKGTQSSEMVPHQRNMLNCS